MQFAIESLYCTLRDSNEKKHVTLKIDKRIVNIHFK